jgi:hypothetical protein
MNALGPWLEDILNYCDRKFSDNRMRTGRPQSVSRLVIEPSCLGMPDGGPWGSDLQQSCFCYRMQMARLMTVVGRIGLPLNECWLLALPTHPA